MEKGRGSHGRDRLIDRLRQINEIAMGAALLLVAVVVIVTGFVLSLRLHVISHQSTARVVAENLGAAMVFRDQSAVREQLGSMQHADDVVSAAVYDVGRRLYASVSREQRTLPDSIDHLRESVRYGLRTARIAQPIREFSGVEGVVVLEVSIDPVYRQVGWFSLAIVLAAVCALLLARTLLDRLSASVMAPIAGLSALMDEVAEKSDFGLRADASDIAELEHLAGGFNEMLSQIQMRDETLAEHRQHLEEMVAARTAEYLEARDLAEAASRAKSAFLSNMSHEIRTPMNAIVGFANVLRREGVSESQAVQLDMINTAGAHLLSIINNILDLSKIEAGKIELEDKRINVQRLLGNVSSMLGERARAKGLDLVVEPFECGVGLSGDATRLQQCLVNYVTNAIKFSERGKIVLRSRCEPLAEGAVMVRFEVSDQGIGIPPEVVPRLFGVFEQADNSMTRRFGGSGLGLVITRHLAQLMGGDAGVVSEPGKGSTFWFTARLGVTLADETLEQESESGIPEAMLRDRFSGRRVLAVDDDPMNLEVARMTLAGTGLRVDVAEDGARAIKMVSEQSYDLILMDMQMPVIDGLMATQRIRNLPGGHDLPIVAMTANAFIEDRERCLAVGMNDFLVKPFDPEHLFRILLKWLKPE